MPVRRMDTRRIAGMSTLATLFILLLAAALLAAGAWGIFYRHAGYAPGAGAAYQAAPDRLAAGERGTITLRLATWGAGGAPVERYRDVVLHVRADGRPWRSVLPSSVTHGADGVTYVFTVQAGQGTSALAYRFTFEFDGQPRSVAGMKTIHVD